MKHQETHPTLDVEGCFGCRVSGIAFGANPSTTRGSQVSQLNTVDKNKTKDMAAYKRLRKNGLQPRSIDGASTLESRATSASQIELGRL